MKDTIALQAAQRLRQARSEGARAALLALLHPQARYLALGRDVAGAEAVADELPAAERAHDFAMLGAAVLVDLDRVEGYAGLGPQGQVDPLLLLREGAAQLET